MSTDVDVKFAELGTDVDALLVGVAAAVVALDDLKVKLDQVVAGGTAITPADVIALDDKIKAAKKALADTVAKDDPPVVVDPPVVPPVVVDPPVVKDPPLDPPPVVEDPNAP